MIPQPPPGQGPIDPRGALIPPPSPEDAREDAAYFQQPNPSPMTPPQQQQGAVMSQMNGMNPQPQPGPQATGGQPGAAPPAGGYPPPGAGPGGWGLPPGYPPGMRPPGYPPPRRRGIGRFIIFGLLIVILGISLFVNLLLLPGSVGRSSSTGVVETTMRTAGSSTEQIAIIPIEGLIDESSEGRVERFINHAEDDSDVKAIVLLIDTPGGTVTASDEIYKRIRKFKANRNVPVVVAMRGMATSGGYYAACAADYICAERTTLTGNIGVLMPRYNFNKLMDKYGIEDHTTIATGATYKDAGSPTRAPTEQDNAYFQKEIDNAFVIFKKVVTDGRGSHLKKSIDEIANGMAYSGDEAKALGLVDEIDDVGYLDAAIAYATKQASLNKPQVVLYHDPPPSLLNLLSAKYAGGQSSAVSINVDATMLDRMASPRMMYLYRGGTDR